VAPPAGSQLGGLVAAALRPLGRDPAAGALLATFGGCSPHSEAYSGDSLEARPALLPPHHFSLFSWPQAPLSCIAGVQAMMGGLWCVLDRPWPVWPVRALVSAAWARTYRSWCPLSMEACSCCGRWDAVGGLTDCGPRDLQLV